MFVSDFSFFDLIVVGQDNLSTLVHNLNNTTDLKLARFTLSKTPKWSKVEEMGIKLFIVRSSDLKFC